MQLRVLARPDLLHEKLRADSDPAHRRSKRLQDLADAQALLEETPELRSELSEAERALLDALPRYCQEAGRQPRAGATSVAIVSSAATDCANVGRPG